jgi:peptidyl-prolyl cis-trans isomerase A (cyclophilin A)
MIRRMPNDAKSAMSRIVTALVFALLLVAGDLAAQEPPVSATPRLRVVTTLGSFVIELDRGRAPLTVEHILRYVDEGYYDGTVFHRVVQGFVAQAGGYTADLQAKPAERTVVNESGNGLSNLRGTVGMARTNDPHSSTSQFYVNLANNLDLNPRPTRWGYTVFGNVVEGMDVVDQIGHRPTSSGGEFTRDVPVEPIVIQRIERIGN